jgi:hypothetical protein
MMHVSDTVALMMRREKLLSQLLIQRDQIQVRCALGQKSTIRTLHCIRRVVEYSIITIIGVLSPELQMATNTLLDFHHKEYDYHKQNGDSPHSSIHAGHLEHDSVQSWDIHDDKLKNGYNETGPPAVWIALEYTRVNGTEISESGRESD